MELQTINFRPLVESQSELAPYLAGLNVSEALEDFGRLADLVLSSESPRPADQCNQQHQFHPAPSFDHQHNLKTQQAAMMATPGYSNSFYSCTRESASPSSPGGASLYSTTTTCSNQNSHWSQVSSPLGSDNSYSNCSSLSAFSSPSHDNHQYSSCSSSASSTCSDLDERQSSSSSRSTGSSTTRRKLSERNDRRSQNATAANRYRKRLRGRRCGLDEELDREKARNSKLMRSFEAKLELYREFADLLASNTRNPSYDLNLARIGSCSLENILDHICPAQFLAQNERKRVELERLLEHFRRVLSVSSFNQRA